MPEDLHLETLRSPQTYEQLGEWAIRLANRAAEGINSVEALHEALSGEGLDLAFRIIRGYGDESQAEDEGSESYDFAKGLGGNDEFVAKITTKSENAAELTSGGKFLVLRQTVGSKRRRTEEMVTIPFTTTGDLLAGEPFEKGLHVTSARADEVSEVTNLTTRAVIIANMLIELSDTARQRDLESSAA